jgi:hypothetical protein
VYQNQSMVFIVSQSNPLLLKQITSNPLSSKHPPTSIHLLSLNLIFLHLLRLENLRPTLLLTPQFLIMRLRVRFQLLEIRIHHFLAAVGALPQHTELISFISLDPPMGSLCHMQLCADQYSPSCCFFPHSYPTLPQPLSVLRV